MKPVEGRYILVGQALVWIRHKGTGWLAPKGEIPCTFIGMASDGKAVVEIANPADPTGIAVRRAKLEDLFHPPTTVTKYGVVYWPSETLQTTPLRDTPYPCRHDQGFASVTITWQE